MRRTLVVALALAAGSPGVASAQDRGEPVVGGGSFNSAPLLEPGVYHDSILPAEYLYYGFRLAAGQRLKVRITHPDISEQGLMNLNIIWLSAEVKTPTRTSELADSEIGPGDDVLETESAVVEADEDPHVTGKWASAGVYYLAVHAVVQRGYEPSKAEIPLTFDAQVVGAAQPNTTPTPTPTPTATPAPKAAKSSGPSTAIAAIGGMLGLLLGAGARLARRRP